MMSMSIWSRKDSLFIWFLLLCSIIIYIKWKYNRRANSAFDGHFWVLSDSHVDILYRSDGDPATHCHNVSLNNMTKIIRKFGHFDCDTPMALLTSAISAAKKIDSNVDFLIWLGDATSHRARDIDTLIFVQNDLNQELRKHFPKTLIIPVLGNHDILFTPNRTTRFRDFYKEIKYDLLINDETARQTFAKGGYYSIRHSTYQDTIPINLRFIVLNTVMFQPIHNDEFDSNEAIEQIEWFNQTISTAYNLNDRILILAHVPFGINENLLYSFYDIKYEQKLLSIIRKYSSKIVMCLSGHRHQDVFRVYSSFNQTVGILGHPSISPIGYLSQPSIRKYSYNRKLLILTDYEQYTMNLIEAGRTNKDEWKFSYRFSSWYRQNKSITSESLYQLVQLVRRDPFYLKRFLLTKHQTEQSKLTNHSIIQTLCALTLFNFDEFLLCTRALVKKNIYYPNFSINNSLEINVLINEQLIEYRMLYQSVAICLFIVIVITFSMIYYISFK